MTFDQLKYFITLSRTLSFSLAAEELYISQSSLSKNIKALELECQVKLFERNTRSISLTTAGRQMAAYAAQLLETHSEMMLSLQKHAVKDEKTLTLYSIPVTLTYGVNHMILEYEREHPEINIRIIDADAQYVLQALRSHKADVIMIRTHNLNDDNLRIHTIIDDELVMLVNRHHFLAQRDSISLRDASNEYFYLLGESTYMYQICVEECLKCGFHPNNINSLMRLETIRSFVAQGNGVSLLMKKVAATMITPDIVAIPLKEKPVVSLALVTRASGISGECRQFVSFATNYFNSHNRADA